MANRSQLYVFSEDEFQVLSEGLYQIPAFWQCLWSEKEIVHSASIWKEVLERDAEDVEEYLSQNILGVRISVLDSQKYAQKNREFFKNCFPDVLEYYDQFVSFVFQNSQDYDFVGIDVTEILLMDDDCTIFIDEILGNLEAFSKQDISKLGVNISINTANLSDVLGYTGHYNPKIQFQQLASSSTQVEINETGFEKYKWYILGGIVAVIVVIKNILGGN